MKSVALLGGLLLLAPQGGPYDADPKHVWNDLHQAMFTWRPTMGKLPAGLEADPLYWPAGQAPWLFSEAMSPVLDRFEEAKGETLVKDPLKRAMLQHDVWMFLDGLEGLPLGDSRSMPPESDEARTTIRRRLTPLLKKVALTPEEIAALPDTYAAAVASGRVAATFDPAEPERPFLPPDLWDPNGPWVLVGREDETVIAPHHVKHFRGRSVFFIFAALPGEREATIKYLKSLRTLKKALHPEPPPAGTRLVLVRRALLLDASGGLHLSPITEEVRIRASLAKPRPAPAGDFEFHLRREDLFAGVAGGLHPAGPKEEGLLLFFHRVASREKIRASCAECHGDQILPMSGVKFAGRDPTTQLSLMDGVAVRATTVKQEAALTMKWKLADKSWPILQPFWPKD